MCSSSMSDSSETHCRGSKYIRAMPELVSTADLHPPGTHVSVNDTRLWVEREGRGEPLLLLSGGPANSHLTFHPAFSALADSYEVIYVDYRGRGRSEPAADYRTVTFAHDVADIDAL